MGTACRCYPGAYFLFYRSEQNNAGGILGNQRAGLPQHAIFAGLRAGGQTLSEMRGNALPYCGWDGETGEICIYGDGVSQGYIGEHAEENKAFEHTKDGGIVYHSGDLGYFLPSGDIAFLHRKDTQIMIYGKRVEVMEVEARLYQCSGIEQAVVMAFTDEDGLSYMTAYIVPSTQDMKVSEVRKELSENLAAFMIPEFIVKMPQIPPATENPTRQDCR